VVEPARIYTKLVTLSNQIKVEKSTLFPDALECFHIYGDEKQDKVINIENEYNIWHTYLV